MHTHIKTRIRAWINYHAKMNKAAQHSAQLICQALKLKKNFKTQP